MLFKLFLSLIYLFFLFVEFRILWKEKINLFQGDNWFIALVKPGLLVLAIYILFYFTIFIEKDAQSSFPIFDTDSFFGYYFTFILASVFFIIYYIRSTMYSFISDYTKSKFYKLPSFYKK